MVGFVSAMVLKYTEEEISSEKVVVSVPTPRNSMKAGPSLGGS